MTGLPRRVLVAVSLAAAVATLSACASREGAAGAKFEPVQPGVLTVATALLAAPGFWQGSPPVSGFEAGLAMALAKHLGLGRVEVVQLPFASIVRGKLGRADIGLSQISPTDELRKHAAFTAPYLSSPPAILARRGVDAVDEKALRGLRWVVSSPSPLTRVVTDRIRPDREPVVVGDQTQALAVLRSGRADALILGLPAALGVADAEPGRFQVLGQLSGGEGLAAVLPKGSHNGEVVDSAIRALEADGTVRRLESKWLGERLTDVPFILTES
jgi:ABC-type amino acid transport substrate-binding protein